MGMFSRLAQARTGYVTGQMQGEDDQRQLAEAERQRTRQDQQDFSAQAIAALNKRILAAQAQAAEQAALTPKPPAAWKPTTMDEAVQYEQQLADARAAAQAKHRAPPVPKGQGGGGHGGQEPSAPKPVVASENERRAAALLQMAEASAPTVLASSPPSRLQAGMAKLGVNEGLSADRQRAMQAASTLVSSYLYLVSGATATDDEVQRQAMALVPQPGDKPEALASKRERVQTMLQAMRTVAGRAASPQAPAGGLNLGPSVPSTAPSPKVIPPMPAMPRSSTGDIPLGEPAAAPGGGANEAAQVSTIADLLLAGKTTPAKVKARLQREGVPHLWTAIQAEYGRRAAEAMGAQE